MKSNRESGYFYREWLVITYHGGGVKTNQQESYYHGFLAGMLKNIRNYIVQSNRESGNGRPDILVRYPSIRGKAVIIEIKVAKTWQDLDKKYEEALQQIEDQDYEAALRQEGYKDIMKCGVAFYRKECMVKIEK